MVDDKQLAEKFHNGDLEALEIIVELYQQIVFRMGLKLFGHQAEAADFVQDAILHAFEKRGKFNPSKPLKPWFLKVALNVGRMKLKSHREYPMGDCLPEQYDEAIGDNRLIKEEQKSQVHKALSKLSPKYRESLLLRFEAELSLKEIAETLGISLGTVKSRLSRGLVSFQEAFQAVGGEA